MCRDKLMKVVYGIICSQEVSTDCLISITVETLLGPILLTKEEEMVSSKIDELSDVYQILLVKNIDQYDKNLADAMNYRHSIILEIHENTIQLLEIIPKDFQLAKKNFQIAQQLTQKSRNLSKSSCQQCIDSLTPEIGKRKAKRICCDAHCPDNHKSCT